MFLSNILNACPAFILSILSFLKCMHSLSKVATLLVVSGVYYFLQLTITLVNVSAKCVWYDECFIDENHKYNCEYTGDPRPLTNATALRILEEYCPTLVSDDPRKCIANH